MSELKENQYAERDCIEQGAYYMNHVMAMTVEKLHSKSDIAAELAHRDIQIDKLSAIADEYKKIALDGFNLTERELMILDDTIQDIQMHITADHYVPTMKSIQEEVIVLFTKLKQLVTK